MFAAISLRDLNLERFLHFVTKSSRSLLKHSNFDPSSIEKDGWGIGYFEKGKTNVVKSFKPLFKDFKKLENLSGKASVFLAHITDASNPTSLPVKKFISIENSQPFCSQGFIFCHNGTLCIPDAIAENLGPLKKNIKGLNESEVLFWQIMKSFSAYGDPVTALRMAVDEINTVWISVKENYSRKGITVPYKGLNIVLAQKDALYCLCLYPENSKKKAIMTLQRTFGMMALRKEKDLFILSSEPLDEGNWENIPSGFILIAKKKSGEIAVYKEKL